MWLGMGRKQLSGVSSHEDVIHVTFVNSLSVMTSTWELIRGQYLGHMIFIDQSE